MAELPVEKKRWPWWKKLLVWGGLPLLLLLGIALVLDGLALASLKAALREARADGGPVTFEELEAARKVWPDEENGALILVGLRKRLEVIKDANSTKVLPSFSDSKDALVLGRRFSPDRLAAAEAELERLEPELAEIDRLLDFEGGCFPLVITQNPLDTILPDLSHVRTAVKLKHDQALCRIMRGDSSELVDDVTIMLRHAHLLSDEPTLISALVRTACEVLAVDAIEQANALMVLSESQIEQLDRLAGGLENQDRLSRGMLGERACFIGMTDYARNQGAGALGVGPGLPAGVGKVPGVRGAMMHDQAFGIRLYNRLIEVAGDSREAHRVGKAIEEEVKSAPTYYWMTHMLFPSLTRAFELDLRHEARLRAARAGLAVERYRQATGRFPETLDALVPAYLERVPLDPFDDQPLRYRLDEMGVVIYSVGEDLSDDGGRIESRVRPEEITDFGFAVLPVELRGLPETQPASEPSSEP